MVIPGKGMKVLTRQGLIGTVVGSKEGVLTVSLDRSEKEVYEFAERVTILPNMSLGATVNHRHFGKGKVTEILSALTVRVWFEKPMMRGGEKSSLMDIRNLRLLSPAPAPKAKKA